MEYKSAWQMHKWIEHEKQLIFMLPRKMFLVSKLLPGFHKSYRRYFVVVVFKLIIYFWLVFGFSLSNFWVFLSWYWPHKWLKVFKFDNFCWFNNFILTNFKIILLIPPTMRWESLYGLPFDWASFPTCCQPCAWLMRIL